jgi:hypothetical protein
MGTVNRKSVTLPMHNDPKSLPLVRVGQMRVILDAKPRRARTAVIRASSGAQRE